MQHAAPEFSPHAHIDPDPDSAFFQRAERPPTSPSSSGTTGIGPDAYALTLPPDAGVRRLDQERRAMNARSETELGPPFRGDVRTAHLPTPQSPSTFQPYMNGASASPLPQRLASAQLQQPQPQPVASTSRAQMVTPDSSPLVAHRWMPGAGSGDTTPTKRRRMSPKTPAPYAGPVLSIKTESPTSSQARRSPPLLAHQSPTQSRLSSPFTPTPRASERAHSPPATPPQPHPQTQPESKAHPSSPSHTDAVSGDAQTALGPDIELERPAGGELTRIRASQARAHAETELRRPDYLRRVPSAAAGAPTGAGVMESPAKGRRIALWGFAETSEESFEERLMAGGYGGYGSTLAGVSGDPGGGAVTAMAGARGKEEGKEEGEESVLDEREMKKRRRLDAFRSAPRVSTSGTLKPVEVEGKGRVLVDVSREETEALVEAAAPRKRGGRRRRAGRGRGKVREEAGRREEESRAKVEGSEGILDWPDKEFPWCVRTMERMEQERMEEAEKLRRIERFLEEDSEESDEEEQERPGEADAMEGVHPPPGPTSWFRGGRGKTVPLRDPNARSGRVAIPTDPADARAALLSKREVRALAYRRQLAMDLDPHANPEPAEDEVVCVCHGRDDGRELVQCDACRTWYHLECIGIHDIAELGREEDPWFCPRCVEEGDDEDGLAATPSSEPTFVPTDEGPTPHRPHPDPLFFQAVAAQDSPSDAWRGRFPDMPTTPTRMAGGHAAPANVSLARSSWTDGGGGRHEHPATPPQRVPQAHVRVQATTPGYERHFMQEGASPFDPTSTPSRGFMFGAPFATPKPAASAVPRSAGMSTPPARHAVARPPPSGSPYRGGVVYDDTPVDRTGPRPAGPLPARKVMDSPLMGRGHARYLNQGLAESPVIKGKGKAKERVGG